MKAVRKKSSRRAGRRWPRLLALMAAGTAVGAGSAVALRRRGQQQWDEYDPGQTLDAAREPADATPGGTLADPTQATSGSTIAGGSSASGGDGLSASAGSATATAERVAKSAGKAGGVLSNASGQARNSRN